MERKELALSCESSRCWKKIEGSKRSVDESILVGIGEPERPLSDNDGGRTKMQQKPLQERGIVG